eukprot:1866874-Alexandrium_andersonii.AAC.1
MRTPAGNNCGLVACANGNAECLECLRAFRAHLQAISGGCKVCRRSEFLSRGCQSQGPLWRLCF